MGMGGAPVVPPPVAPPPVAPPPPVAAISAVDAAEAARDALTRLQAASDLAALSVMEREALLGSLIRALSLVHSDGSTLATPPVTAVQPPPPVAVVPPPPPVAVVPPPAVAPPVAVAPPLPAPPPRAPPLPRPSPVAVTSPATAATGDSEAQYYRVDGMESMSVEQYRNALKTKLNKFASAPGTTQAGRSGTASTNPSVQTSDSYQALLDKQTE